MIHAGETFFFGGGGGGKATNVHCAYISLMQKRRSILHKLIVSTFSRDMH